METVTITAFDRSYRINNPGSGRVGSKLNMGTPYERKLLVDIYQHHHEGVAFDVGAHIGNHSLWLAAICGLKVYAWEPHDLSREQLEANIALNPELDITVFDWAAGDEDTVGRFTKGMWLEFDPDRDGATMKTHRGDIPVHPIDDHLDVPVSVVKIDVEGMEPNVLRGMRNLIRKHHPTVYAETHTPEAYQETKSILAPYGYRMTRNIDQGSPNHRWE